jgi:predicted regulator of Ras-like GTPase activity (Roadblock/LC7/MglB family)
MPPSPSGGGSVAERVRAELQTIRDNVAGVHGSLAATSDGLLVAHDLPDLEPAEVAALAATTQALASRTTAATGCGQFRETVARGSDGYLAVYPAGERAIVAIIGTGTLNVGMLRYQVCDVVERVAAQSAEFGNWAAPDQPGVASRSPGASPVVPRQQSRVLPRRRGSTP